MQNKMCNEKLRMDLIKSNISHKFVLSMDGDELKLVCLGLQQLADSEMMIETEEIIDSEIKEYAGLMVEKLKSQRKGIDDDADSKAAR